MKQLCFEKSAFEMMMGQMERLAERAEQIYKKQGDRRLNEWFDNQDVCEILNVSKRTLQTLRSNGVLAYSQIGHKVYYRAEDVAKLLKRRS